MDEIRNHSMTDADAFKRSNEGMRALVRFNNRFLELLIGYRLYRFASKRSDEGVKALYAVHGEERSPPYRLQLTFSATHVYTET